MKDIDLLRIEQKNSLGQNHYPDQHRIGSRPKRRLRRVGRFFTYLAAVFFIIFFVFTSRIIMSEDNSVINTLSFFGNLTKLAKTSENMLKGEADNRINILLLGMGGQGHEGGLLTDTIILASIIPETKGVSLLSIPRDLIIPIEGYGWRKINHVNAFAEMEEVNSGGIALSQALSRVLDMPIDYYIRADFAGFEQLIDDLGGIEIEVENLIDDHRYPILGEEENENYESRFNYFYLEPGTYKMDGGLALKYARSRHSTGIEGSDFARSRRQQKILQAVKEKIMNKNILLKPLMITNVLSALKDNIDTNLKTWEIAKFWSIIKEVDSEQVITKTLDNSLSGLLIDSITADGAYVLEPRTGDFREIQYFAKNIMENAPPQQRSAVSEENVKLEIQNGTWVNGLGQSTAIDLDKFGFDIVRITNATRQNYEKSVIFDLTYGEKIQSLEILKERTGAKVNYGLPDWFIAELAEANEDDLNITQPDFILILGRPADITKSGMENEEE